MSETEIESELAFSQNGEPFAVPATATAWRVRRLRGGRGAPELMYGRDGRPLVLGMEAGMDELREAVEINGRYRLDAIDEAGKNLADVPPAYVQVTVEAHNSSMPEAAAPSALSSTEFAIRELTRANGEMARANAETMKQHTELAKAVATQQPELVKAAAEILRAADGAGLPRRDPLGYCCGEGGEEDEESDDAQPDTEPRPTFNFFAFMQEIKPLLSMAGVNVDRMLAACGVRLPAAATAAKLNGAANRSAQGRASQARTAQSAPRATDAAAKQAPPGQVTVDDTTDTEGAEPFVAADPMAHVLAIQTQLTPDEQAFVHRAIKNLKPADLVEWRDQLARMPVEEGVAQIRAEIEKVQHNAEQKPEEK